MISPHLSFIPPVIAHRGARNKAPENTLAAFKLAKEQGAVWMETDVKLTQDGVPVLMHDDTLDRTTNGHGSVASMDWAVLQGLDAGSWFDPHFAAEPVPRMSEVLRFILEAKCRINLEIKPCPGRTKATTMVTIIEASKLLNEDSPPPLISSFDVEALVIAAQMQPEWPRGLLLEEWHENWANLVKQTGAGSINLSDESITRDRVDILLEARIPLLVYTVNDPTRVKELLHWGVRAVFSDNAAEIIGSL